MMWMGLPECGSSGVVAEKRGFAGYANNPAGLDSDDPPPAPPANVVEPPEAAEPSGDPRGASRGVGEVEMRGMSC